jgi:hypothetical protein
VESRDLTAAAHRDHYHADQYRDGGREQHEVHNQMVPCADRCRHHLPRAMCVLSRSAADRQAFTP